MVPGRPRSLALLIFLLLPVLAVAQDAATPADLPFAGPDWRWSAPRDATPPELVPALGGSGVVTASSGTEMLAVWSSWKRIVAARIAGDGTVLGRPVVLGTRAGDAPIAYNHLSPRVAWNGERYLVVWQKDWFSAEGQFVAKDGSLLGGPMAFPGSTFGGNLHLASNGETFLLASGSPVVLALISGDGYVYRIPADIPGGPGTVASDGEDYLLLISSPPPFPGSAPSQSFRISRSGGITTASTLPQAEWSSATWLGDHYLAVNTHTESLFRLDRDGRPIGEPLRFGQPFTFADVAPLGDGSALVTLGRYDPARYLYGIRLVRVEESGAFTVGQPLAATWGFPGIASAGGSTFFFWGEGGDGGVRHAPVDTTSLTLGRSIPTVLAAPDQTRVRSVATDQGFFAVWQDRRAGGTSLRGAAIDRRGGVGPEVYVGDPAATPALASGGGVVLVAWFGKFPELWGRRFTPAGAPLDPEPFLISAQASPGYSYDPAPAVAWDGETFVVAWVWASEIRAARITPQGTTIEPQGVVIYRAEDWGQAPLALASTGGTSLLVWQEGMTRFECRITCTDIPPPPRLLALRFDKNLNRLDPTPFELLPGRYHAFPTIAANDGVFLVAGIDPAVAVRVDTGGRVLGVTSLHESIGAGSLFEAEGIDVAAAPGGFVLAASTAAADRGDTAVSTVGAQTDHLRLLFVPRIGEPGSAIRLRDPWFSLPRPDVSVASDGTMLLLFSGWREDLGLTRRAAIQMLAPPPPPRRRTVQR